MTASYQLWRTAYLYIDIFLHQEFWQVIYLARGEIPRKEQLTAQMPLQHQYAEFFYKHSTVEWSFVH